jgi:hypothetical protein
MAQPSVIHELPGDAMTFRYQWTLIESRIRGLMRAVELHTRLLAVRSGGNTFGRSENLREQGELIVAELSGFRNRFRQSLPAAALSRINEFVARATPLLQTSDGTADLREEKAWAGLVVLGAFETELSYLLSDTEQAIRSRSELAFAHLQRSIVVDETFRKQWQAAFSAGEIACEKLGAVHLLSHGIWAFKANAEGERTDLVYQEPSRRFEREQAYADGLVLTEWKKATPKQRAEGKFEEARNQAHRYAGGVLAGNELTHYRYVIVVSEEQVQIPEDIKRDSITYRHINIATKPKPPSKG